MNNLPTSPADAIPALRESPKVARLLNMPVDVAREMVRHEDYPELLEAAMRVAITSCALPSQKFTASVLTVLALTVSDNPEVFTDEMVMTNWLEDVAGIPADILEASARDWRRQTIARMPTPGELKRIADRYVRARSIAIDRLKLCRDWSREAKPKAQREAQAGDQADEGASPVAFGCQAGVTEYRADFDLSMTDRVREIFTKPSPEKTQAEPDADRRAFTAQDWLNRWPKGGVESV